MNGDKKDESVEGINLEDIKIKIHNLKDLSPKKIEKFENKNLSFNKEDYLISFNGEEYYVQKKCHEGDYEYLKTLSKQDLKADYKDLMRYLEKNFGKERKNTEVEVFFKSKKVPYYNFILNSKGKDVFVKYVNKEKGLPHVTTAAYIALSKELNKKGYKLVASNQQFSSGKLLWNRLEKYGYVKREGSKRILDSNNSPKTLEKIVSGVFGFFILTGLFFLSPNLTSNVVGNIPSINSNFLGAGLFFLGIIGFFVYKKFR